MWKTKSKISDYILPLDKFGKIGKVHSVFANSLNIQVGKQLINVANYHEYLSCFGMYLPTEVYGEVAAYAEVGSIVKMGQDKLTIYSNAGIKSLSLADAEVVSLRVTSIDRKRSVLESIDQILEKQDLIPQLGLPLDERFTLISKALAAGEALDWSCLCRYLIGRGKGLTPSGDDLLTAYLFVLIAFADPRAEALSQALMENKDRTTDISRSYLVSCHDGYVNSLIYQFYLTIKEQRGEAAITEALGKILTIGHTSGKDMCYGLWLGIQSLLAQE